MLILRESFVVDAEMTKDLAAKVNIEKLNG